MRTLNRIVAELFAIFAIWLIWDWRMAATLAVLMIVLRALQEDCPESRGRDERTIPTLDRPVDGAPRGGGPSDSRR